MENKLPKGWEVKKLVKHIPIVKTGVEKYKREKPYFSTGAVSSDGILPEGNYTLKKRPSRANRLVIENDVVQARMKESRKAVFIDKKLDGSLFSTGFLQFRPEDKHYNSKLLYYYLRSDKFLKQRDEFASGSTQIALTDKGAKNIDLVIPPESEQKRIADKLDVLLAKVKDAQSRLDNIPLILKRFRQSILAAVFSGELTKEWRRQNKNNPVFSITSDDNLPEMPKSWIWKRLSDIALVKGGVTKGRKLKGKQTVFLPYLRVANVQDGFLDLNKIKEIEVLPEDQEKYRLKKGDLLFTEGGDRDKLGRGTIWQGEIQKCIHQNHIFRARITTKSVMPQYVSLASKSEFSRSYFFEHARQTVNLASINMTVLSALLIPIPPLGEQEIILLRVSTLFKLLDNIEARYKSTKLYIDTLEQSILAKAFRGELI